MKFWEPVRLTMMNGTNAAIGGIVLTRRNSFSFFFPAMSVSENRIGMVPIPEPTRRYYSTDPGEMQEGRELLVGSGWWLVAG